MTPREPVKVVELAGAPPQCRWQATYGDWDLDDPMGIGGTPEEAIEDLEWAAGDDE